MECALASDVGTLLSQPQHHRSTMYDHTFPDAWGHPQMVQKWYNEVNGNPTGTPNINFAEELFYTMGNISSLLDVNWWVLVGPFEPTRFFLTRATIIGSSVSNSTNLPTTRMP